MKIKSRVQDWKDRNDIDTIDATLTVFTIATMVGGTLLAYKLYSRQLDMFQMKREWIADMADAGHAVFQLRNGDHIAVDPSLIHYMI